MKTRTQIMKNRYAVLLSILAVVTTAGMLSVGSVATAEENPLAKYQAVPGAATTLPVSGAKKPFPLEFMNDARARFENFQANPGF